VRNEFSITKFDVVMEDDGSRVPTDVLSAVIDEGERIGTLMVLQPSQSWTKPSDGNHSYHSTALSIVASQYWHYRTFFAHSCRTCLVIYRFTSFPYTVKFGIRNYLVSHISNIN